VRIVVTGASGNVGTALLRRAAEAGDVTVTGICRRPPPAVPPYDRATWIACDVGTPQAPGVLADALAGADALVHLAWAINPGSTEPPMERTNLTGADNVLLAAAEAGVPHLLCASSVAAYRPPARWREVDETWPLDGVRGSAYSRGKARLEDLLDRFAGHHPNVAVARIRPCAVVQRDAGGEYNRWLLSPLLPAGVLGRHWLPLPFWPGLRAQLVHADDVAKAIALILERRAVGAFNLAAGPVLDAEALAERIGGPVLPLPRSVVLAGAWATWRLGAQPAHPGWLRLADQAALVDTRRARTELGWRPHYDSPAALADVVAGMRAGIGTASPALASATPHGVAERLRAVHWGTPSRQAQ
jgi:nucleoside-diphosphate-sugar epimerase